MVKKILIALLIVLVIIQFIHPKKNKSLEEIFCRNSAFLLGKFADLSKFRCSVRQNGNMQASLTWSKVKRIFPF